MERHLILLLALAATGLGTTAAVLRPGVFVLGQSTGPPPGSGVSLRSGPGAGLHRGSGLRPGTGATAGRARWERFQGRGPGGAK